MIWLQMLPVLCIWLAWIFWRRRTWTAARDRFSAIPRGKRIALSLAASILGPALLLAGLVLLDWAFGLTGTLTVPTLASIVILGVGFIELQMAAVAITGSLVADNVTAHRRPSSKLEESEEDRT